MIKKLLLAIVMVFTVINIAYANSLTYTEPTYVKNGTKPSAIGRNFNKEADVVWDDIHYALDGQVFVIINSDKSKGTINVSYVGDPEAYINCGHIKSHVKTLTNDTVYNFPAAAGHQIYEITSPAYKDAVFSVDRVMDLEAQMLIIVFELEPGVTRVIVTTKYVVTRTMRLSNEELAVSHLFEEAVSFSTNQGARMGNNIKHGTYCIANGKFEQEVMKLITEYE